MSDAPLLFVVTGQSNAGQQGRAGLAGADAAPVPGAWYYAPQHTRQKRLLLMQPYRGVFGVELSFARAVRAALPEREIVVAKVYSGGTSIVAWQPDAPNAAWELALRAVANKGKPPMFPKTLAVAAAVAAIRPVQLAGVLGLVVERDSKYPAGAARYGDNLTTLIEAWRRDWHAPGLPVVVIDSHTQLDAGGIMVHDAIINVAYALPGVGWAETRDLGTVDGVHFDTPGVVELGRRMAVEWLRLAGECNEP
jgi:hypothetical protein